MFTKKHRESLRGLSHEDKVKKLEKLTRVPLQNLKTNIIESDLEEDDIVIPISLKLIQTEQTDKEKCESVEREKRFNKESKKKQEYDQERINRTIRAMTNELYSLEKEKEKENQESEKNKRPQPSETNISSFTIEEIDMELEKLNRTEHSTNLGEPIKHKRHQSSFQCQNTELTEISLNKFHREENNMKVKKPQLTRRREFPTERQTEPLYLDEAPVYEPLKTIQKLPIPENYTNKRESSESNLTKRFSRTKRNTDLLGGNNLQDKKLKFNRSCNQKNNLVSNPNNKENIENFQEPKKTLMTERLSYQQIPTYESVEVVGLKKRRNIGKFFITNNLRSHLPHTDIESELTTTIDLAEKIEKVSAKNSPRTKEKIKEQVDMFEKISSKSLFKELEKNQNSRNYVDLSEKELLKNVIKNYKQSVELLKTFL